MTDSSAEATIRLAVATAAETLERIRDPLSDRGIAAAHLPTRERAIPLDEPIDGFDVGFVFPPRVVEGATAAALADIPWVNDRRAVLRSRNKAEVIARLERADLPVPRTVLVSDPVPEATLQTAFSRFDGGVVVKPTTTTRGVGVARATDLDTFLGICDYVGLVHDFPATGDKSFLVQEFLPEARDIRAMVLEGTVVGAVERRLPSESGANDRWKHNVHRGARATPIDPSPRIRRLAERTAAALEIDFLGVDLLATPDRVVVSETNARPTIDDAEKYDPDFYDRPARRIRSRLR